VRKELPLVVMILAGLAAILPHYFVALQGGHFSENYNNWVSLTFYMAVPVGLVNMTQVHWSNIRHRRPTLIYSVIFLVVMYGYAILGLVTGTGTGAFKWIFDNALTPLGSTVFSLLAFMTVSAVYRSFRIRSREMLAFVLTALVVMLGAAPIGDVLIHGWSTVSSWFLNVPVNSGFRAIWLGVYLGSFGVALRILLGLERGHLSGVK
jgi:hypothetical protein